MYEQYANQFNPNSYFPQAFSQPAWSYQRAMPQGISNVRFVDGISELRNCSTPLGTRMLFMDKNEQKFYVKETDFANISSVKEYTFQEAMPANAVGDSSFVTRQEFDQWKEQYESSLRTAANNLTAATNGAASTVSKDNDSATCESPSGADDTERFSF